MNLRVTKFLLFLAISGITRICFGHADSLLNLLMESENPEQKADLFNSLADLYLYRNLDTALMYTQEAITISKNAGYQKGEILALINKSEIYRESGEYHKATGCVNRVKDYAESLTDKVILAKYYLLSATNFFYQHRYNKAIEMAEKAFMQYRECDDLSGMGNAQRRIGQAFHYWQEYDVMYEYYLSALDCYQKAGDRRGIAATLNNIGIYFYLGQKDYDKAESYINRAIALNKENGNIYWLSKNYMILSAIKEIQEKIDSSFYYSEQALYLARKVGNPLRTVNSLIDMGILYQSYENDSAALTYYYEALHLAEKINSFESLGDVADYIRAIYYKQGLIDSAYLYQEKHFIYADSLNKDNSNLKFTELKHELETELERQKTELRIQKRFYIYLLVFTILVLTIVILVLLYTRQKIKIRNTLLEKDNLSKSIELKNRELANSILNSQKKNELINTAIRDLEINKDSYPETSRQLLNQVISNLGTAMDENGWKDFELIFSQVHESFFIGLDQRCPGLSTKERRLCALLRLDMSSKEIAEVTQMTPRSVDTARYRLRKKLGIENNEESDLLTFMRSF